MGRTKSRRGRSAAPAARPSRKRRHGGNARAATPAKALAGEAATGAPSANAIKPKPGPGAQAKPAHGARVSHRPGHGPGLGPSFGPSFGRAPATVRVPAIARDLPPRAPAAAPVAPSSFAPFFRRPAPALRPGPSLRQDKPQPPLRYVTLRTQRELRRRRRDLVSRARAGVARTVDYVIACLDAWIWQPVLWPFRPAQREMLARTLAVLAVAIVAAGWVAVYSLLAPAHTAHAPAPPPPPPKVTARIVPHPLPSVKMPKAEAPKAEALKTGAPKIKVPLPVPPPTRKR